MSGLLVRRASILAACLAIVLVGGELLLGPCLQEDAFISFRYARNLVDGNGLVYNRGERVEGYTNFLWTVGLAGGMALGADPEPLARFAGMAWSLGLFLAVWTVARRRDARRGRTGGLVAALAVALSASTAAEAVQGLETTAFACLVTVGVVLFASGAAREAAGAAGARGRLAAAAAVLALAALTRPEGAGVMGLATLGTIAWRRRRGLRPLPGGLAVAWAVFLVPYLGHVAWRLHYYDDLLPNTFYAKTGGGLRHLARGLRYVGRFLALHPGLTLLSALGAAAGLRARRAGRAGDPASDDAESALTTIGLWVVVGYLGYVCVVGGDFKETFRFVIPILGVWAILLDGAVSRLADRPRPLPGIAQRSVLAVALAVLAAGALVSAPETARWSRQRARDLVRRRAAGLYLAAHAAPDATLAIGSAGIIPYYSRLYTIDAWGLTDRHIAHLEMPEGNASTRAGHEKHDWAYVFSREPDYFVDGWYFVTEEPVPDLRAVVRLSGGGSAEEIPAAYRTRNAELPPVAGEGSHRLWFNWMQRDPDD